MTITIPILGMLSCITGLAYLKWQRTIDPKWRDVWFRVALITAYFINFFVLILMLKETP